MRVSWPQALAWRMRRQLLHPIGRLPVVEVVRQRCGVQAQVTSSAELAIRIRSQPSRSGDVSRALERLSVILGRNLSAEVSATWRLARG